MISLVPVDDVVEIQESNMRIPNEDLGESK